MLEELQLHKNHEIYERAVRLLETYYNLEVGGEDDIMQMINEHEASGMNPNFEF
jgi:hypothetical protein